MRTNLKILRIKNHMSQEEMSKKISCSRATYSAIENGTRSGKHSFWEAVRNEFNIAEADMWELMRNE